MSGPAWEAECDRIAKDAGPSRINEGQLAHNISELVRENVEAANAPLVEACRAAEFALDLWIQTWEANPMMRAAFPGDPSAVPRTFDALAALRAALQKAGAAE